MFSGFFIISIYEKSTIIWYNINMEMIMFNRVRTLETFGYDIDPNKKSRRSKEERASTNGALKKHLMVIDNCPSCSMEREIQFRNSRKNKLCSKCFHNTPEMVKAKQNQNKIKTEEHKQKMRDNHWSTKGIESPFKGQSHSDETKSILKEKQKEQFSAYSTEQIKQFRIQASCTVQGIPIEDFNGFTSPENTLIRQSPEGKAWSYDVLVKANFTCEKCSERGGSLNSHHKNAFNAFPDQRFNVDNGACLCKACHDDFHSKYGKGSNTEIQFVEWLNKPLPTVYLLVGAPASGKSWVASQLTDKFDYISYDGNSKKTHLDLLKIPSIKPKLYDPTFKISTIIRRHSNEFNFILVGIYEEEQVLRDRMNLRGGTWTDTVMKRNEVAKKRYEKYGTNGFLGSSQEVLEFLKEVV